MISNQNLRKLVLAQTQDLTKNWPKLGQYLRLIVEQQLYEQWGFKNFLDYLEQELRVRQSIIMEIIDSAHFFQRWFPNQYQKILESNDELPVQFPSYESVNVLVKYEKKVRPAHQALFKEIVHDVFANKMLPKDIITKLSNIIQDIESAGAIAISEFNTQLQIKLNEIQSDAPHASGSQSISKVSRRSVWDNVTDSRIIRAGTAAPATSQVGTQVKTGVIPVNPQPTAQSQARAPTQPLAQDSYLSFGDSKFADSVGSLSQSMSSIGDSSYNPNIMDSSNIPLPVPSRIPLQSGPKPKESTDTQAITAKMAPGELPSKSGKTKEEGKKTTLQQWITKLRALVQVIPVGLYLTIVLFLIFLISGIHFYKKWKIQQNEQQAKEYLEEAEQLESLQQWQDAIAAYNRAKLYVSQETIASIEDKIASIETRLVYIATIQEKFSKIFEKAQRAEDLQHYQEALAFFEEAKDLYEKEFAILSKGKVYQEMGEKLLDKIISNRTSHEILMNKTLAFRKVYMLAEKYAQEGKWQDAYIAYQRAYELDHTFNPELEKKINDAEKKHNAMIEAKFREAQLAKGLLEFQGRWVTPEEKMHLEGFKKYQNQWVSGDLFKALMEEEKRVREEIQAIQKNIEKERELASKIYLIETVDAKRYRGEILEKKETSVSMKLIFPNGFVERTFPNDMIQKMQLENMVFEEYYAEFANKKSLYDQMALIKWAQEKKLQELIVLARCQIFLLDFSHPEYQRIPMFQKDGIWWKK